MDAVQTIKNKFSVVNSIETRPEKTKAFAKILHDNFNGDLASAHEVQNGILGICIEEAGLDSGEVRGEWVKLIMSKHV